MKFPNRSSMGHHIQPVLALRLVLAGLVLWVASGTYMVGQGEKAVVLRLGQYTHTAGPGVAWNYPAPLGRIIRVNTEQLRTLELGGKVGKDQILVTRDQQLLYPRFGVQYSIADPYKFVFHHQRTEQRILEAAQVAMRETVANAMADDLDAADKSTLESAVRDKVQALLRSYGTGVTVHRVRIHGIAVPEALASQRRDLERLRQDHARALAAVASDQAKQLQRIRAETEQERKLAEEYAVRVVATAQQEAAQLAPLLAEYERSPQIVQDRLYLEAVRSIGQNSRQVIIDATGESITVNLDLGKPATTPQAQPQQPVSAGADTTTDAFGRDREAQGRERGERP